MDFHITQKQTHMDQLINPKPSKNDETSFPSKESVCDSVETTGLSHEGFNTKAFLHLTSRDCHGTSCDVILVPKLAQNV